MVLPAGNMDEIKIKSELKEFKINFVDDFSFVDLFLEFPYYVIVVGSNVYKFYKNIIFNRFPEEKVVITKLNENRKTLDTVMELYKKLLQQPGKRPHNND